LEGGAFSLRRLTANEKCQIKKKKDGLDHLQFYLRVGRRVKDGPSPSRIEKRQSDGGLVKGPDLGQGSTSSCTKRRGYSGVKMVLSEEASHRGFSNRSDARKANLMKTEKKCFGGERLWGTVGGFRVAKLRECASLVIFKEQTGGKGHSQRERSLARSCTERGGL